MIRRYPVFLVLTVLFAAAPVPAAEPATKPVTFTVNGATTQPISPFIYGTNMPDWAKHKNLTLCRWGGNRITAYNWETNASNAGSDWNHQNDAYLSRSDTPGEPVRQLVQAAHEAGASAVVSIPCIGYVSADKNGDGDVKKTPDYLNKRFVVSLPKKNAPFAKNPDLTAGKVFQDEFVAWLEGQFPESRRDPARTIFYALDNEPDLWSSTHARIHPKPVTYDELVKVNTDYAEAIKAAAPKALVFGFVSYGYAGFATLQNAPDAKGRDFLDFYLEQMRLAEKKAGKRLIDVLDLHWYPEARGGGKRITDDDTGAAISAARIQAPRSLWDASCTEESWITKDVLHQPIRLLPRVQEKIARHYPGTKLAITEYYYGGGANISGALAQADVLGIFGREGVFAAALWHEGKTDDRFIYGAFAMFRDYDDRGGCFGDTGLAAQTDDAERTSIYASQDAKGNVVLVAVNKAAQATPVTIKLKNCPAGKKVAVFQLTEASSTPVPGKDLTVEAGEIRTELPAQSVRTMVMLPE